MLVIARERFGEPYQIQYVSYPGGEVRTLINNGHSYSPLSVTADSRTLVTEVQDLISNIWVVPDGDAARARQITYGGQDGLGGLTFDDGINSDPVVTPDGRYIVFSSYRGGHRGIWRMNIDGGEPKQLAGGGPMTTPYCSSDGRG